MERGRILILGQTKENTYEIRNLLDHRRFELEIALSRDVGKQILSQRKMNLLILHTEAVTPEMQEFFEFLEDRRIDIPVFVVGEEASRVGAEFTPACGVTCFDKPYAVDRLVSTIKDL